MARPEATTKCKMRSASVVEAPLCHGSLPLLRLGATKNDALLEQKQILAAPLPWFQIPQPVSPIEILLVFRVGHYIVLKLPTMFSSCVYFEH